MTIGEARVRTTFNPSNKSQVEMIKQATAALIDICEEGRNAGSADGEHQRLWKIAQTYYEDAAMWAVKAATF